MGYIRQKLRDILGQSYGIYWLIIVGYIWQKYGIYWSIKYIKQKLRDTLGKIMGYKMAYIDQKLWDIFDKNYRVYWVKLWDMLQDIIGNIFK